MNEGSLRLASSVFAVTITGAYAGWEGADNPVDPDMVLVPDLASLRLAPGAKPPAACVFADPWTIDGSPWPASPRNVLARVVAAFAAKGWAPVIAPELEFYLVAQDRTRITSSRWPHPRTVPPPLTAWRPGPPRRPDRDDPTTRCEVAEVAVDTTIARVRPGPAGDQPAAWRSHARADEALVFKRIVRQAAREQGLTATFMAYPLEAQPRSAMHLHLSLVETASGANLFADTDGADSQLLRHFIGGLQKYLPRGRAALRPQRQFVPPHAAALQCPGECRVGS